MKQRIIITDLSGQTIFDGKPITLPIYKEVMIEKSIELFDDEDPCVIHESYSIQKIVDELTALLKDLPENTSVKDIPFAMKVIDLSGLDNALIRVEVKKK